MTARLVEPPSWAGETVAILGTGPSLTPAVLEAVRGFRTIAVNHACRVAPWATAMLALDGLHFIEDFKRFAGLRLSGFQDHRIDAFYVGLMQERVTLQPGHTVEMRNSGLAAIRLAAIWGASRILLCGFNPETGKHIPEAREVDRPGAYPGLAPALDSVLGEIRAGGVAVEFFRDPEPALVVEPEPGAVFEADFAPRRAGRLRRRAP